MELLGQRRKPLHDALDIHHHGLHRSGQDGQLLLEEVAGQRDALPDKHFVGRAADAGQVNSFGPFGLGIGQKFRILGGHHEHFRKRRFMAVDDHIDHIRLQHAQVGFGADRSRGAEEDVSKVGGQHGAAPPVGQRTPHCLIQQVFGVLVVARMGPVEYFDDFPVDGPWGDPEVLPDFLAFCRCPFQVGQMAVQSAKLSQGGQGDIPGDFLDGSIRHPNAQPTGRLKKFVWVPHLVIGGMAFGRRQQGISQVSGMVGMGSCAGGHRTGKVPGHHRIDPRPAHAPVHLPDQSAWPHRTIPTTKSLRTDRTGDDLVGPTKTGFRTQGLRPLQ